MHKKGQKCLKNPENQQSGAQKNLNSGLYLKILIMPGYVFLALPKGQKIHLLIFPKESPRLHNHI